MPTHARAAFCLLTAALAFEAGCVRPQRSPNSTAVSGLQCRGGYAVTATNNTQHDVDIWQLTSGRWEYWHLPRRARQPKCVCRAAALRSGGGRRGQRITTRMSAWMSRCTCTAPRFGEQRRLTKGL